MFVVAVQTYLHYRFCCWHFFFYIAVIEWTATQPKWWPTFPRTVVTSLGMHRGTFKSSNCITQDTSSNSTDKTNTTEYKHLLRVNNCNCQLLIDFWKILYQTTIVWTSMFPGISQDLNIHISFIRKPWLNCLSFFSQPHKFDLCVLMPYCQTWFMSRFDYT